MASEWDTILTTVRRATGIDLGGYRRPMLDRRLAARMAKLGLREASAYLNRLETSAEECSRFVDTVGINVSWFFRNPLIFEILRERIIPRIVERKRQEASREIRVWSAGCGAGEEAYSLAILFREAATDAGEAASTLIFATDIDGAALSAASVADYPRSSLRDTRLGVMERHFDASPTGFKLSPAICEMVRFSRHDLVSHGTFSPVDSVFASFDLVLCRNVIIYLCSEARETALGNLRRSLAPGGYLVLGEAETVDRTVAPDLEEIDSHCRIFRRSLR